jgi:hypothetical protein
MGNDDGPMTADTCFSLRPLPVQKITDWLLRLGDTGISTRAVPARQAAVSLRHRSLSFPQIAPDVGRSQFTCGVPQLSGFCLTSYSIHAKA